MPGRGDVCVCVITRSMTALLAQSRDAGLFVDLCGMLATLGQRGAVMVAINTGPVCGNAGCKARAGLL